MKLLMILVDDEKKEELEALLERAGVAGYTEIPRAVGSGETGMRLGSRAFPKTTAVLFTMLEADAMETLVREIDAHCKDCGERVRMVSWGVESVL